MKPLNHLKAIHSEHFAKLQCKQAAETEILDDLRTFCKQRASIDRDYGQALQRLSGSFLTKRQPLLSLTNDNNSSEHSSVWHLWKSLLNESSNFAISRIRASDTQQQLYCELKPLKAQRATITKRVFDQLRTLQNDLAASVQEMTKSHKVYSEEEKQAQDFRLKTMAAEEKIRRKSTNLFHSMAQLRRNYEKLVAKRQAYNVRSAAARNEYLFQLAAINAHLRHYFTSDIPSLLKALNGELYEKLSEVVRTLCRTEAEICGIHCDQIHKILDNLTQVEHNFPYDQTLKSSLFQNIVQYQFEPIEGDDTTILRSPDTKEETLHQITRKLARRVVLREHRIKSYENELKTLQSGCVSVQPKAHIISENSEEFETTGDELTFNQEYLEHKLEELQFAIRREEIERVKIEACLSLLRRSSIDVNSFVLDAREAAEKSVIEHVSNLQRSGSPGGGLSESGYRFGEDSSDSLVSSSFMGGDPVTGYSISSYPRLSQDTYTDDGTSATTRYAARQLSLSRSKSKTLEMQTTNRFPTNLNSKADRSRKPLQIDQGSKHDYQNVNNFCRNSLGSVTRDDMNLVHGDDEMHVSTYGTDHNRLGRGHSSGDLLGANTDIIGDSENNSQEIDFEEMWSEHGRLRQASVLYEFRAKRSTEIDLVIHETVVLLEEIGRNGWIKVRSLIDGNEGIVPINYLRLHKDLTNEPKNTRRSEIMESLQLTRESKTSKLEQNVPIRNVDLNKNVQLESNISDTWSSGEPINGSFTQTIEDSTTTKGGTNPVPGTFVRTLIEYSACGQDELSFLAGSVIRVIGRAPVLPSDNGDRLSPENKASTSLASTSYPDDGWWEGDLLKSVNPAGNLSAVHKRIRGVFASMLVEYLTSPESKRWQVIWQRSQNFSVNQSSGDIPVDKKSSDTPPEGEYIQLEQPNRKAVPASKPEIGHSPGARKTYRQGVEKPYK